MADCTSQGGQIVSRKVLTSSWQHGIFVAGYTEVMNVAAKSRPDDFRKRRNTIKQFSANLDKEVIEALDKKLKDKGMTRTDWLKEKIKEELSE